MACASLTVEGVFEISITGVRWYPIKIKKGEYARFIIKIKSNRDASVTIRITKDTVEHITDWPLFVMAGEMEYEYLFGPFEVADTYKYCAEIIEAIAV